MSDREIYEEGLLMDLEKANARIEQLKHRLFQCATDLKIYMDAFAEERDKLTKAMRIIDALVEDEGYIPKRVESDYLDLYKTLDESL